MIGWKMMIETNEELDYKELEKENAKLRKMIEEIRVMYEEEMWELQNKNTLYWRYWLNEMFGRYGLWKNDDE